MIRVQQMMLLEVITYLILHGADGLTLKDGRTNKTALDMALDNQLGASKKKNFSPESIENKIVDILKNTKQKYFHPKLKRYNN